MFLYFLGISYSTGKSGPHECEPTPRIAKSIQILTNSFFFSSNECSVSHSCFVVNGFTEQEKFFSPVTLKRFLTAKYLQA